MALHPSTCPLDCPDACGVLVETDAAGALLRVRGNPEHPYSRGVLCSKTAHYHELVQSPERLLRPLVRRAGVLVEASWDEALALIAKRVKPLAGERILALEYAGSMGLVARRFPMRMIHALGGVQHDGGVCDTTSTAGYSTVLGRCIGPDVESLSDSDAAVIWGSDVKRTIQHLQPGLQKLAKGGAPLAIVDIYRTDTVRSFEKFGARSLIIHPGTDAALALAICRAAFERGWVDRERLAAECLGAKRFEAHLCGAPSVDEAARICGLEPAEIEFLSHILRHAKQPFLRTGSGWTRRTNGAMGMRAVCSLAALLGHAERVHYESGAVFTFDKQLVERPDLRHAPLPPPVHQIQVGRELNSGRFGAVFIWGHNPAVTLPDSRAVRLGLSREDVFCVVHEQFLTETAELADVVLPATTFVEHSDLYQSYGHRVAQYGRAAGAPPPGPRNNVDTFCAIARALGLEQEAFHTSADELCLELIRAASASLGAEAQESLLAGKPTKIQPPTGPRGTPSGRVELFSTAAASAGQPPMATFVPEITPGTPRAFSLVSAPSKHTHNTTFSRVQRHRARSGEYTCHINPLDARRLGLATGDLATLVNDLARITLPITPSADMPPGLLRVDGQPQAHDTPEALPLNALHHDQLSDLGSGTTYMSTRVDLVPQAVGATTEARPPS
ncbi:MAG: molybdopterin-dependent oxidoreductase [bacterium]